MRILICLLLLLALAAPAVADDWDGDRVIRKNRKARDAEDTGKNEGTKKNKDSPKHERSPLGMYFGNGDEFLESGAPITSSPTEEEVEPGDTEEVSEDSSENRSAIFGPRHKPPTFFDEPAGAEAGAEEETAADSVESAESVDLELAAEPEAVVLEKPDSVTESVESEAAVEDEDSVVLEEPADSDEPAEEAHETVEVAEPEDFVESEEPAEQPNDEAPEPARVDPDSGLARYSSYPAMQGTGKPKHEDSDPEAEDETEESEDEATPRPRGGIRMHDPDTW